MSKLPIANAETKKQRIEKRLSVLRAIRNGGEYTKEEKVLKALEFGSLIALKYEDDKIVEAKVTGIGEQFIFFYEAMYK